jgi:hypothetical protein
MSWLVVFGGVASGGGFVLGAMLLCVVGGCVLVGVV